MTHQALSQMTNGERTCVVRFLDILERRLHGNLVEVWLFGSFARGDTWGPNWPMNSDVDLLILTERSVAEHEREELINETYPLYLECGRQISAQFRTVAEFQQPTTEAGASFKARIAQEGRLLIRVHHRQQ